MKYLFCVLILFVSGCGAEWEPSQETYTKQGDGMTLLVPCGTSPVYGYKMTEFDYKCHHYLMVESLQHTAAGPQFAIVPCDPKESGDNK